MTVSDECINCGACVNECESNAIYNCGDEYTLNGKTMPALSEDHSFIVPELCQNCKACADVCAVGAIQES